MKKIILGGISLLLMLSSCKSESGSAVEVSSAGDFELEISLGATRANRNYKVDCFSGTSKFATKTGALNSSGYVSLMIAVPGTSALFLVYVDTDSNGIYDLGGFTQSDSIGILTGITLTSSNLMTMISDPVKVQNQSALSGKTLNCWFLVPGSLNGIANIKAGLASGTTYTQSAGSGSAVIDGSGNASVTTTVPIIPTSYDTYCFADINGNNQRNAGDYEGQLLNQTLWGGGFSTYVSLSLIN